MTLKHTTTLIKVSIMTEALWNSFKFHFLYLYVAGHNIFAVDFCTFNFWPLQSSKVYRGGCIHWLPEGHTSSSGVSGYQPARERGPDNLPTGIEEDQASHQYRDWSRRWGRLTCVEKSRKLFVRWIGINVVLLLWGVVCFGWDFKILNFIFLYVICGSPV